MIAADSRDASGPLYRWFALGLLYLANVLHVLDRQVFAIVQDSIKRDLRLSDTVLGLLGGLAFALFYATLGVPIARLADRGRRTRIVAAALFVWSGMTALCGVATGVMTLALARIGVGIGEAGCSPATQSLLADYFPPKRLSSVFALLTTGTGIGLSIGLYFGATLDATLGWRRTFVLLWIPGLLLSILIWFGLREPTRGRWSNAPEAAGDAASAASTGGAMRHLWSIPTLRYVLLAYGIHFFAIQGTGPWKISYFRRAFADVGLPTLGSALGAAALLGLLVVLGGGVLVDRLQRRDERWMVWLPALTILCAIPFYLTMLYTRDWRVAVVCYGFDVGLNAAFTGPTLALIQRLVPPPIRATAAAVVLLLISLFGMGLGPVAVGLLSDALHPAFGAQSLRPVLIMASVVNLVAIVLYRRSAGQLRRDLHIGS